MEYDNCLCEKNGCEMKRMICIVAPLIWALTGGARAQEPGNPALGLALAKEGCVRCHAVTKGDTQSPDPRAPAFEAVAKSAGLTRAALFAALQTSHRNMADVVFKGDDMANVVAYIVSLKVGD